LPGFIHARSTDGGATFTRNGAIYSAQGVNDTLAKVAYHLLADPSDAAHLAFCYVSSAFGDLDVVVIESSDGGSSWGSPARVNSDPQGNGVMQDLAWATFDTDGDLAVTWRDRRNGTGVGYASASEVWGAVRWHDSLSFQPDFRISDTIAPYNSVYLDGAGNDAMCAELRDDTLFSVWGDVRNGALDIWFNRRAVGSGNSTGLQLLGSESMPRIHVHPNPAKDQVTFTGDRVLYVRVFDVAGRSLLTASPQANTLSIVDLPSGTLLFEMGTEQGVVRERIEKE
jgi:hypothetical protein